jgi:hypothetical protein
VNIAFGQSLTYKQTAAGIEISDNKIPVLFYQVRPKNVSCKYERAGYIHPLYDLQGNILTEDAPEDHPYHRGVFWAWHQVIVNDKNVADGWISENIRFETMDAKVAKLKNIMVITSRLKWEINSGEKALSIINETSQISIYPHTANYRVIDINIKLTPVRDKVKLGGSADEKGYGGFCLRLKLPSDIKFVSADDIIEPKETAVTAGPWIDFVGSFSDGSGDSGIALMAYTTKNESHPWILRKSKSMQNVPFPGRTPLEIPKDGLSLNYRVVIHDNHLPAAEIAKLYDEYVNNVTRDDKTKKTNKN